jgi:hypothetical protein
MLMSPSGPFDHSAPQDELDAFLLRPLQQLCGDLMPGPAAVLAEHRNRHVLLLLRGGRKAMESSIQLIDPGSSR